MVNDVLIIRELAKKYAEIAHHPIQKEKRARYRRFNDMEDVGHMVLVIPDDDGVWQEIIPPATLQARDPFFREYEFMLRRLIFHAQNFMDDQIFEPYLTMDMCGEYTGYHYGEKNQKTAWGLKLPDLNVKKDSSYSLKNLLATKEDYDILLEHKLDFIYDKKQTEEKKARLLEALDGELDVFVRMPYSVLVCSLLIELVHLRGMNNLMLDVYDEPDMLHKIMAHMSNQKESLLLKLEKEGSLVLNNDNLYTGSGGVAYTNRLPAQDYKDAVRLKDIWGFADAQEFAVVSNEMFKEFIFPYQKKPLALFGLSCYGCCEKVDEKLDDILTIPNIWRISVSPWSDINLAAEKIGRKAIYSRKPNPSVVSVNTDTSIVKKETEAVLKAAKGCQVEFVLKDLRTCNSNPNNIIKWVEIAKSYLG